MGSQLSHPESQPPYSGTQLSHRHPNCLVRDPNCPTWDPICPAWDRNCPAQDPARDPDFFFTWELAIEIILLIRPSPSYV